LGIAADLELIPANLSDFRQLLGLIQTHQPDEIYNLAAQSSVGLSFRQPLDSFHSIINGASKLLGVSAGL